MHGCRPGCPLSPLLFNSYLEAIIQQMELKGGVRIGGTLIQEVRYADDVALVTTTQQELEQEGVQRCMCEERNGSELGQNKAVMVMQGDDGDREAVNIGDERVDVVQSFQYLGRIFSEDGGDMKELRPKMCNGEG